ncbi:MAG: hypothetical protein ACP5OA_06885 [Candidatus Woesearchaeota archaeon]
MKEFDWLGSCTSCNKGCCHNTDKFIRENECNKPEAKTFYETLRQTNNLTNNSTNNVIDNTGKTSVIQEQYDNRPLECRLFPFDIKEIEGKLVWVKWNGCHASPKLDYEKFINFFERKFSREIPLGHIKQYVENQKSKTIENPLEKGYIIIKEMNWPSF